MTKRIAVVSIDDFADREVGPFAAASRAGLGAEIRRHTPGSAPDAFAKLVAAEHLAA